MSAENIELGDNWIEEKAAAICSGGTGRDGSKSLMVQQDWRGDSRDE